MKTVYIAHSVTNASQDIEILYRLVSWLKGQRQEILLPNYALFPESLALSSLRSIERSDVIIADVTAYSHGVGFELGYAYALKKDIIVICGASAANSISKFLVGMFPGTIFYRDQAQLIREVAHRLGLSRAEDR